MNGKTLVCAVGFATLVGCSSGNCQSGDRVLVAKCLYDTNAVTPRRYDVVVFKYPVAPVEKNTPKNYIKRLIGLPGEIIAIFFGRLYRFGPGDGPEIPYRKEDDEVPPNNLWQTQHRHDTDKFASEQFDAGNFKILRKPPDVLMALRRIVFDNDYQASDLVNMVPPRWNAETTKGWKASDDKKVLSHQGDVDALDWLRYQNLVVERSAKKPAAGGNEIKPQLITDRMGYNSAILQHDGDRFVPLPNWVGDLMLEFNVEVQKPQGELHLELSRGIYRYQARFNLADGLCTLWEFRECKERLLDRKETQLESKATRLKGPGNFLVRFANIDSRLTVWVDREMPFGDGVSFPPPEVRSPDEQIDVANPLKYLDALKKAGMPVPEVPNEDAEALQRLADHMALMMRRGPTQNDLQPTSIGSKGAAVTVRHLTLWRDTYYTTHASGPDYASHDRADGSIIMPPDAWSNPGSWGPLQKLKYRTLYVQPGHYLCLGDNSTASSDSREWGLVPERLLLGRALAVYYPINRLGPIK
jgi:signal peptidase I